MKILYLLIILAITASNVDAWRRRRRRRAPTPINCQYTGFGSWSACSRTCNLGQKTRTRTITRYPAHGGTGCPSTRETIGCFITHCPIDCVVGSWGNFGSCSGTCGHGKKTRHRAITRLNQYSGTPCPDLVDHIDCVNEAHCPIDCELSSWSTGQCSVTCEDGIKTSTRNIITHPAHGGQLCESLQKTESCNIPKQCPRDCKVGGWNSWGLCSTQCGVGEKNRTRTIRQLIVGDGDRCPPLIEKDICKVKPCPINCQVSAWSTFGDCSATCGEGKCTRTRLITQKEKYGGKSCGALSESQNCNLGNCQVDCAMSDWTNVGKCSKYCGGGYKEQHRKVLVEESDGGKPCLGELIRKIPCNVIDCPICKVGYFGPWSKCSRSCGGGFRRKIRKVWVKGADGKPCKPRVWKQKCNTHACIVGKSMNEIDFMGDDIDDGELGKDYVIVEDDVE